MAACLLDHVVGFEVEVGDLDERRHGDEGGESKEVGKESKRIPGTERTWRYGAAVENRCSVLSLVLTISSAERRDDAASARSVYEHAREQERKSGSERERERERESSGLEALIRMLYPCQ